MISVLSQFPVERLGWVLVHSLWQFALIALVVRLLDCVLPPRAAQTRYRLGLAGLAVMTLVPVATWIWLPAETPSLTANSPPTLASGSNPAAHDATNEIATQTPASDDKPPTDQGVTTSNSLRLGAWPAAASQLNHWIRPALPFLVGSWIAGMLVCSFRPALGWWTLQKLRTTGLCTLEPPIQQHLQDTVRRIARRLNIRPVVQVFASTLAETPLVVGYLRPIVLMPIGMISQLTTAELEAIIAHELAHIRRQDFLVNLWQLALETVFFYHPAVWFLSNAIRTEREHCCDDVAVSLLGDPVCYGRALLHVEELRGSVPVFALGAGGGPLSQRIRRLLAPTASPTHAASPYLGLLFSGLVLVSLVATRAWAEPEKPAEAPRPAPAVTSKKEDSPKEKKPIDRSLDIVIAEHVIVWDNRIRVWDEVETELREIRKSRGKPIHPNFYFTNGAHAAGHWDTYKKKSFDLYAELFEPTGVSYGSLLPRASARYDVLRTAEDLTADSKVVRRGRVTEKGQPRAGVLVMLVTEGRAHLPRNTAEQPVYLNPDLTLRNPLDENWTTTDEEGRFSIPVRTEHTADKETEPPRYALAAISSTSYRLAAIPKAGEEVLIELEPLGKLELLPVEGQLQRINLVARGGLPKDSPGFALYEIDLSDKPLTVPLPPGEVMVLRTYPQKDGTTHGIPSEAVKLKAGEIQRVTVANITEEEARRKWLEKNSPPKP